MPLKIIKAETVDQVISQFNDWEKNAIEEKNEQIRAQMMLARMQNQPPPVGLMVMALQLNPATWEEKRRPPYNIVDGAFAKEEGYMVSGWILSFLHNHQAD